MRHRFALALLVGAALVLVTLAARGNSPMRYESRDGGGSEADGVPRHPNDLQTDGAGNVVGASLLVLLVVLLALFLFGLIGVVIALTGTRRRRAARAFEAAAEAPETTSETSHGSEFLLAGAKNALAELRERPSGPPSDAVVAAWLRLEQAAADSGVPRHGHQTPTEFTGALLLRHEVDTTATATLRGLYQRARFGAGGQVTARDATRAVDALECIVADLASR